MQMKKFHYNAYSSFTSGMSLKKRQSKKTQDKEKDKKNQFAKKINLLVDFKYQISENFNMECSVNFFVKQIVFVALNKF